MKQYVNLDFQSPAKATGLPVATANGEPVVLEQFQAALEGIAWKDDVRVASTGANINLAAPGTTIDGVTMALGDRFLAKDQTNAFDNGIYVFATSSTAATRAPDMSTSTEFNSAIVPVASGTTNAGTQWRQTAVNPTVGTTPIVFVAFLSGAPPASETVAGILEIATTAETNAGTDDTRAVTPLKLAGYTGFARKAAFNVGDASNTSFVLTHNLNTRDVDVAIVRAASPWDAVVADWAATSVNTVTITFASAPTLNQYRAVITG